MYSYTKTENIEISSMAVWLCPISLKASALHGNGHWQGPCHLYGYNTNDMFNTYSSNLCKTLSFDNSYILKESWKIECVLEYLHLVLNAD